MDGRCLVFVLLAIVFSQSAFAGSNIGYGYIRGIKVGHLDQEASYVYLKSGYAGDEIGCNGVIALRYSKISEKRLDQIFSVVLSAQLANKKVRFHSHTNDCDITFAVMQESVF